MFSRMPLRLQRPVSRPPDAKLLRAFLQEAARLRQLAANVTTIRLRARLMEEADNQERLAEEARRGTIQPFRHVREDVSGLAPNGTPD